MANILPLFLGLKNYQLERNILSALHAHYHFDINLPAVFRGGEAPLLHLRAYTARHCFVGATQTRGRVNVHNRTIRADSPLQGQFGERNMSTEALRPDLGEILLDDLPHRFF